MATQRSAAVTVVWIYGGLQWISAFSFTGNTDHPDGLIVA